MRQNALKSFKVYKCNFQVVISSDVGTELPNAHVMEALRPPQQ